MQLLWGMKIKLLRSGGNMGVRQELEHALCGALVTFKHPVLEIMLRIYC